MTREEFLNKASEGGLPDGYRVENGKVYNACGLDVTAIGNVIKELIKAYDSSVDVIKSIDSEFESENDGLVNLFLDLATLEGDSEKILHETNEAKASWVGYAHVIQDAEGEVIYKLLLIHEITRVLGTLEVYLSVLKSLGFVSRKDDE